MGRHVYLTRLALGRSPFQAVTAQSDLPVPSNDAALLSETTSNSHQLDHGRQYDMKGRPVSQATEERKTSMRRAQNSVLKLVGVVQDRAHSDHDNALPARIKREARCQALQREDERSEVFELLTVVAQPLLSWWLECFTRRIKAGLYDPRLSFGSIMRHEWRLVAHQDSGSTFSAIYPGAVAFGAYSVSRVIAASAVDAMTQVIASAIWTRGIPLSRPQQDLINSLVRHALDAVRLALDVALLPLMFYSTAQQIGVAPTLPLLPPLRALLPGIRTIFDAAWKPRWHWSILWPLCTPAALLLAYTYLQGEVNEGTSVARESTDLTYPATDDAHRNVVAPSFQHDPLGRTLYEGYRVRLGIMRWCGWTATRDLSAAQLEDNLAEDGERSERTYRCSARLAQMPAKYLSWRLDELFVTTLTVPFESVMLNAVATAYLSSRLPLTELGEAHRLLLQAPDQTSRASFGFRAMFDNVGTQAVRLSFTLGLRIAVEATMFAGLYGIVKHAAKP